MNKQHGFADLVQLAVIGAAVAAVLAALAWQSHRIDAGRKDLAESKLQAANVATQFAAYRSETDALATKAANTALANQAALHIAAATAKDEHEKTVLALRADVAGHVEQLRQRAQRPAGPAAGTADTGATSTHRAIGTCTGADLYRQDAIALVGIAADADQLRADYAELFAGYEAARLQALGAVTK